MSTNLSRPVKNVEFAEEKYLLMFDMTSVKLYKEISEKSYVRSISDLAAQDDEAIINFLGATMRKKETPNEPIGKSVYEMDIAGLLTAFNGDIVELVTASMPKTSPGQSKAKGK